MKMAITPPHLKNLTCWRKTKYRYGTGGSNLSNLNGSLLDEFSL
jgi:hypothetical protein